MHYPRPKPERVERWRRETAPYFPPAAELIGEIDALRAELAAKDQVFLRELEVALKKAHHEMLAEHGVQMSIVYAMGRALWGVYLSFVERQKGKAHPGR